MKKAYHSGPKGLCRCQVRRRKSQIPNRSSDNPGRPAGWMVQPEARHSIIVGNRSRIHCGIRTGDRCSLGKTILEGNRSQLPYPEFDNGQRGGVQLDPNNKISPTQQAHRSPLPLHPTTIEKGIDTNKYYLREGEPGRYLHQDITNECGTRMEVEMVAELEPRWDEGVGEEPLNYKTWLGGYILSGMLE